MSWGDVGHWITLFVRSPGFGRVAAVGAAAVAFHTSGKAAETQRETAAHDRWWDQAKWTLEGINNPDTEASAIGLLGLLADNAPGDDERAFLMGVLLAYLELTREDAKDEE